MESCNPVPELQCLPAKQCVVDAMYVCMSNIDDNSSVHVAKVPVNCMHGTIFL